MATVKVKFRASSVEAREGSLYYQVIHRRRARRVSTGCKLYPAEWDAGCGRVVVPPGTGEVRRAYLHSLKAVLAEGCSRLADIIERLECTGSDYTVGRIVELYDMSGEGVEFFAFTRQLIQELRLVGRVRTAETYASALNSFARFRGGRGVLFEEMDSSLMVKYETYLKARGVCPNSSSYYLRNLRAIYNRAVERGAATPRPLFRHVYTGVDKTVKRAVPLKVIRRIRDLDLAREPALDYARDLFLFSFYTRGMSFVDMAFLRKRDLQNGVLSYRRKKTGQQLFIKWERPMQDIVSKYDTSATPYLLPIIRDMTADGWRQYRSAAHLINVRLKKLGRLLELGLPLTSYVARHTWASVARSKNVSVSVISEAMGHDSESTTRIYLASLDTAAVDKANRLVLNAL